jgi:hypothetical protein
VLQEGVASEGAMTSEPLAALRGRLGSESARRLATLDLDGDGIPDALDPDLTGNGVPNEDDIDLTLDSDGDGPTD